MKHLSGPTRRTRGVDGKFVAYGSNPNQGSSIYLIDVAEMNKQLQVRK